MFFIYLMIFCVPIEQNMVNMTNITDSWKGTLCLDENVILIDLFKSFDCVLCERLIAKLKALGFHLSQ